MFFGVFGTIHSIVLLCSLARVESTKNEKLTLEVSRSFLILKLRVCPSSHRSRRGDTAGAGAGDRRLLEIENLDNPKSWFSHKRRQKGQARCKNLREGVGKAPGWKLQRNWWVESLGVFRARTLKVRISQILKFRYYLGYRISDPIIRISPQDPGRWEKLSVPTVR